MGKLVPDIILGRKTSGPISQFSKKSLNNMPTEHYIKRALLASKLLLELQGRVYIGF